MNIIYKLLKMLIFVPTNDNNIFNNLSHIQLNKTITKNYVLHNKVRIYIKLPRKSSDDILVLKNLVVRRPEIQELILYISKVTYSFLYAIRQMIKNNFVRILVVSPEAIAPNKLIQMDGVRFYIDKEFIFNNYILTL